MKIIIIEGTDNVGKDTVIQQLTYEFTDTFIHHCEKPKSIDPTSQANEQLDTFINLMGETLYFGISQEYNDSTCLIHNRSWYGEYVYGCMYRQNNPEKVKEIIRNLETCLLAAINPKNICYITLLSNNSDFLVRNDDGLSISKAKQELIEEETKRFIDIHNYSNIDNKHIVYVNDGDTFRPKEDIINEILGYIFNDKEAENKLSK